jgi:hypothetical protein
MPVWLEDDAASADARDTGCASSSHARRGGSPAAGTFSPGKGNAPSDCKSEVLTVPSRLPRLPRSD